MCLQNQQAILKLACIQTLFIDCQVLLCKFEMWGFFVHYIFYFLKICGLYQYLPPIHPKNCTNLNSLLFLARHSLLQFGATAWLLAFCFYILLLGQVYFLLMPSRALHQSSSNVNPLGGRLWASFSPDLQHLWQQMLLTRGLWHSRSLFW